MKKIIFIAGLMASMHLLAGNNLLAGEQPAKTLKPKNRISKKYNIHFTGKECKECHEKTPVKGGNTFLKYGGDFEQLCRCHHSTPGSLVHPWGIVPSKGKIDKIPAEFPLKNGKLSCGTCHDIALQCQESPKKLRKKLRKKKKFFLRGEPYKQRTDFCFKCHNQKSYEMQDVHDQVNDNGEMLVKKCQYCHTEKPDVKKTRYKNIKLIENPEAICQGCHVINGNHSGNYNHMIKPSEKALERMKNMETMFGIILPLYKGKISCMTCHNPHEKGVIPAELPSAKGADSKFRHRLPNILCQECHKK
jgi:hypothetical protein